MSDWADAQHFEGVSFEKQDRGVEALIQANGSTLCQPGATPQDLGTQELLSPNRGGTSESDILPS
jgi:hypothetical protein